MIITIFQNDLSVLGDIDMRASPGPPPPMGAAASNSTVVGDPSGQAANLSAILSLLSGDPNAIIVDPQNPNATSQLLSQILQQQIQQPQQQQQQTSFFLPNGQQASRSNSLPETGLNISVQGSNTTPSTVNRQASAPVMSSLQAALLSPSPLVSQKSNKKNQNINKSSSAPAIPNGGNKKQSSQQLIKKDGFVVPQVC